MKYVSLLLNSRQLPDLKVADGCKHALISRFRRHKPGRAANHCLRMVSLRRGVISTQPCRGHWKRVRCNFVADMHASGWLKKNEDKHLNAGVGAGCLQLWCHLHWELPPWQAPTHAKYTLLKGSLRPPPSPPALTYTLADTVSYCVWELRHLESRNPLCWPLTSVGWVVDWHEGLRDFQVAQRAVRGSLRDNRTLCADCFSCLVILANYQLYRKSNKPAIVIYLS